MALVWTFDEAYDALVGDIHELRGRADVPRARVRHVLSRNMTLAVFRLARYLDECGAGRRDYRRTIREFVRQVRVYARVQGLPRPRLYYRPNPGREGGIIR
mgnify:CR=1 FL=1